MSDYDIREPDNENEWHISCYYDDEKESLTLRECLALFEFEIRFGLDASISLKGRRSKESERT